MMFLYDPADPLARLEAEEKAYQHRMKLAAIMADLERKERRTRRIANVAAFVVWAAVMALVWWVLP
jgi:hypothetical protein